MLLLSSLLGPVKPPVATRQDIDSAPGLYQISDRAGTLVATAAESGNELSIANGERCLICLCGYEANEELRQLLKCSHIYHKECIEEVKLIFRLLSLDILMLIVFLQWLTTGRNSCPLCRRQGVGETPNATSVDPSAVEDP